MTDANMRQLLAAAARDLALEPMPRITATVLYDPNLEPPTLEDAARIAGVPRLDCVAFLPDNGRDRTPNREPLPIVHVYRQRSRA